MGATLVEQLRIRKLRPEIPMNKAKLALITAALLGALSAQAQNLAKSDQQMLLQLAQGNMAEIEA
eukprot:gene43057-53437_t